MDKPQIPADVLGQFSASFERTGTLAADVPAFLAAHGYPATATHCRDVAEEATVLARTFGVAPEAAAIGGWLHDVSAVIPVAARVDTARAWGVPVLDAELQAPMILHQKLSAALAEGLFGVTDPAVLWAIRCHTTLRGEPTPLDKVVFLADKIAWDQAGTPPYLADLQAALAVSLDAAVRVYLGYLWARRATLAVVHPWLQAGSWMLGA